MRSLEILLKNLIPDMKICLDEVHLIRKLKWLWQKIKVLLQTAIKINLTADTWSKKGMSSSFLGVTAHFFNRKYHKSLNTGCSIFETPHTGRRILHLLKTILSEYDIGIRNIGVVLTDNGSNMIKAFNADSLRNLEDDDEDEEQDDQNVQTLDKSSGCDESFESTDIAQIHEYESNEEDHVLAFTGFCQRLGCFSHTLQLVMSEFDTIHSLKKVVKKGPSISIKV